MKKATELDPLAPRPTLDFSKGVRGKHFNRMQQGTNIVLIAPDLLDTFPDSESVNEAAGGPYMKPNPYLGWRVAHT
jgi:hypothetical protein